MRVIAKPYKARGLTQFGVFHNLWSFDETGYIFIHLFGRQLALVWERS
jgi:hypothetical protein